MAEWDLKSNYDYRFGALMLQASCGDDRSPIYHLRLSDILRHVAPHELRHYLQDATQPYEPEIDLDEMRRKLITDTDWKGKVCLDAAGHDGWAAKLALDCGASRAICLDNEQYMTYGWDAKRKEGVEYITGDIFEWTEPVDKVILYNVAYHVKSVWGLLEHVRLITKEEMLLCSLFRYHDEAWVYLYDERECNPEDVSVIWGPSIPALERLLKFTGWTFQQEGLAADRVVYRCWPTLEPQSRNSKY